MQERFFSLLACLSLWELGALPLVARFDTTSQGYVCYLSKRMIQLT
jgi:hypothetical protein